MPTKVSTLPTVMLLLAGCLSVLPGPCSGEARTEAEPNNAFENATMLGLGDSCTGSVGFGADDVDYFGFNVTKATLLTVTVTVTATRDGGLASVDNASRKTVGTGFGIAAGKSWTWQKNVGNDSGTWFLSVRGAETNYTVNLQGTTMHQDLPPIVSITSPANNSYVHDLYLEVNGTATDESGVREVLVYMEGMPQGDWVKAEGTSSWRATIYIADYSAQTDLATILARASDTGGKVGIASIVVQVRIPMSSGPDAPALRITEPANDTVFINTEEITVRGTAYHQNGIREAFCYVTPGNETLIPLNSSDGFRNWTAKARLLPGESTITVHCHDNGHNYSYAHARVRLNITTLTNDTTPPTVNITNLHDGSHIEKKEYTFRLEGTAWDDHRVVYVMIKVNAGKPKYLYPANLTNRYVWSQTIWLKEGANTINVTAYDYSNNSASKAISVDFKPLPTGAIPGAGAPALAGALVLALCILRQRRAKSDPQ